MAAFDTGSAPTIAAPTFAQQLQFRSAVGAASLPWKVSGCVAAWHIDDVEVTGGKITQWNDLVGSRHLTQADSGKQATYEQAGAKLASAGYYDITGGLTVDNRAFTVIEILSPSRDSSSQLSNLGYLLQVASGISIQYEYFNTTLATPTRYVQPLQIRQRGASSFVVVGGSADTRIATNGAFATAAAYTAGTSNITKLFSDAAGANGSVAPVRAVLVFDRALTESEVLDILAYFSAVEIGGDLSVCVGDSITAGVGATDYDRNWVGLAASSLGSSVVFSGRGGRTAAQVAAIPSAQIIPSPGKKTTYSIFLGTNDLADATGQEATLRTNISTILSNIRTADPRATILLFTILPRVSFFGGAQDAAGFETDRSANNVWRRTLLGSTVDILADVAANGTIGDAADASNVTYYPDGTHPSDAGYVVIADVFVEAMNPSVKPVTQGGTGTATGSITGTGALTFTAGGTNQAASLRASGTGTVSLNAAGAATSMTLDPQFSNALIYMGTQGADGSRGVTNYVFLQDGTGVNLNSYTANLFFKTQGTTRATLNATQLVLEGGIRLKAPTVPASAAAAGTAGDISWDADFIYVCTATNTWKRVAIATW